MICIKLGRGNFKASLTFGVSFFKPKTPHWNRNLFNLHDTFLGFKLLLADFLGGGVDHFQRCDGHKQKTKAVQEILGQSKMQMSLRELLNRRTNPSFKTDPRGFDCGRGQ